MITSLSENVAASRFAALSLLLCLFLLRLGRRAKAVALRNSRVSAKKRVCGYYCVVLFFSTETSKRVRPYAVIKQRLAEALHVLP